MHHWKAFLSFTIAVLLLCAGPAFGDGPKTLNYQGFLTDNTGKPVPSGNYNLTFRLYGGPSGGSALWSEAQLLPVNNGVFTAILGKISPIGLAFDTTYYMSIQIGADAELSPRIEMTSMGSSFWSLKAKTVTGPATGDLTGNYPNPAIATGVVTSAKIADGTIVNADISAIAAIAASKISGDAGLEYRGWSAAFYGVAENDATVHNMGSVALTAPTDGYIVTMLSGYIVYFGDNKTIRVGISTASTTLPDDSSVDTGRQDGSGTLRYNATFTSVAVMQVTAGITTVYALAQGNTTFGKGTANVVPQTMASIFIPKHY